MEELNLSDRLRLIAGLIKKGSKVADIGTDHGYLPIFLVKSGTEILPELRHAAQPGSIGNRKGW